MKIDSFAGEVLKNELDTKTDLGRSSDSNRIWAGTSEIHKKCDPHALRGAQKKWTPLGTDNENRFFQHPLDGNAIAKSHTFSNGFSMVFKSMKISMHFCTPQAFWASHFLKLQNWRSPNVTLTVVSWKATLAAGEVLKKIRIRILAAAARTFFCAPRLAWGCHFCHLMRIPVWESLFSWWQNLEVAKKMMLPRGFGASQLWKSRARKNW